MSAALSGFRSLPLPLAQLSLAAVLKCGQSFRWSCLPLTVSQTSASPELDPTNEYRICLKDRVLCLRQTPHSLHYRAIFPSVESPESSAHETLRLAETLAFIRDYFQLDVDLETLYSQWGECDPIFNRIKERFSGIRILRQDPWETLVSFICSANNNISRISKMVQTLCIHFTESLLSAPGPDGPTGEHYNFHPFPPPSALAHPSVSVKLRHLGFGYRAEYIQRTAEMLIKQYGSDDKVYNFLSSLRTKSTDEAREELLKLMGVGRKVADCILLMSMDKSEVIPVDTHVYQIAVKQYGMRGSSSAKVSMTPKLYDDVNKKLSAIWGRYAGWAHSVLFTADLKAFAGYGLDSRISTSTTLVSTTPSRKRPPINALPTPSPSPIKRKRTYVVKAEITSQEDNPSGFGEGSESLAERVKRRRTMVQVTG